MRLSFFNRSKPGDPAAESGVSLRDWNQTMESAAARELLRSEFHRASLLLITALLLILAGLTIFTVGRDDSPNLQARLTRGVLMLGALAVYEGVVLAWLVRWRLQPSLSSIR